ncbi:MAG: NAD(P)/FAD-dependent oxidoreductase [Clostridia bacterium]|nr:NAD(P)/FAD-dependent oxidoreductase [Clostridia bacterium]
MDKYYDIVVVGAGPAGMMAAGAALEMGAKVLLLDKLTLPGKKLLITGKGRCNVTNNCDIQGVLDNVPRNPRFLYSALNAFPPAQVMDFFEKRGVPLKTERGQRVFPVSDKAADIAACLKGYAAGADHAIGRVTKLCHNGEGITGVETTLGHVRTSRVILATGGLSYPATGSTGDGYAMAEEAGHTIVPPKASLVPLKSDDGICRAAMGVSLRNVKVRFFENGKCVNEEFGEMLFTHFGVSGPVILSGSAHFEKDDSEKWITIDLKPALDEKKLDARLLREFEENINRDVGNIARHLLPQSMTRPFLRRVGIAPDRKANSITRLERERMIAEFKGMKLGITGLRPVEEAIVTRGGVNTREVDPKTMASKKLAGLYFAGEILDVDAYTGGYNIQIALATGRAAGRGASQSR